MADILIVRSNCDAATLGTYWIGDGLKAHLQAKGHTVMELADTDTTPGNVLYWLTSSSYRTTKLLIALDHGSPTGFYGEVNNQVTPVITMSNVKDLTQGLHVYTFACSTCAAGGIGEKAINDGAFSWLGYTEPVYVFTDPNSALFKTLKEVIWSYITKLADGFTVETAEKALRDGYTAHLNDNPVFKYNLDRLMLRRKAAGVTIHSHNRLGGKSLIGTWGGMVDWEPAGNPVAAGQWTFKNDGTWTYANGGGRWIQIDDTAIWTFNNAPGLTYTCIVSQDGLKGVMGYTSAPPNAGKGRFTATRAIGIAELPLDPMIGPTRKLAVEMNGHNLGVPTKEWKVEPIAA